VLQTSRDTHASVEPGLWGGGGRGGRYAADDTSSSALRLRREQRLGHVGAFRARANSDCTAAVSVIAHGRRQSPATATQPNIAGIFTDGHEAARPSAPRLHAGEVAKELRCSAAGGRPGRMTRRGVVGPRCSTPRSTAPLLRRTRCAAVCSARLPVAGHAERAGRLAAGVEGSLQAV